MTVRLLLSPVFSFVPGAVRSVAVIALLVLSGCLSGCCVLDDTCTVASSVGDDESTGAPPPAFDSLDTPGCDAASIREAGDVVCADCVFASAQSPVNDDVTLDTICGRAEEARCEVRENSAGQACQLCVTDDGDILYDDCFSGAGAADRAAAFCEDATGTTDNEICTSCFDADGNTVSTSCAPRSDECQQVVDGGRTCTVCTVGGNVVSRSCDSVDLDPSVCRAYENEAGRCVDCLDDNGALLSHACTPATGPSAIACEETVTPEGIACTVCVDENGTPFDRFCGGGQAPARCEQLAFTEQTCVICLDDGDAVVSVDCQRNDCAVKSDVSCRVDGDCLGGQVCFDGACVAQNGGPAGGSDAPEAAPAPACEPPPACVMSVNDDGEPCRTCPLTVDPATGDPATGEETLCIAAPALRCSVVAEDSLPADPGTDGEAGLAPPPEQGRSCVICADRRSGVEVYRDCAGNGNVPPPYCLDEVAGDGSTCSVCYDAVDNTAVYTSCAAETCFDLERQTLVDGNGIPLLVTGDDGVARDAVAACKQCGDANDTTVGDGTDAAAARAAFSASCALENVCQDPYGSSFAAPSCPTTTTLTLAPRVCGNPWDAWLFDNGTSEDVGQLQAIVAYALGDHAIALGGARLVVDDDTLACPTLSGDGPRCDCPSDKRIELAVVTDGSADDSARVDAVRAAFAGLIVE